MLKNIVQYLQKINEKDYTFLCENDSATSDIKEFCFRLLKYVGQIEDQVKVTAQEQCKNNSETSCEPVQEQKPQE